MAPKCKKYELYVEPVHVGNVFKVPPVRVETINDIDGLVYDLYAGLRRAGGFEEFGEMLRFAAGEPWPYEPVGGPDPVGRVWRWWRWFRGKHGSPEGWPDTAGPNVSEAANQAALAEVVATLPAIHERLQRVQIEDVPPDRVVRRYAVEGAYCYCAPYGADVEVDHEALLQALMESPALVVVVAPPTSPYVELESRGWLQVPQHDPNVLWRNFSGEGERFPCVV